MLNTDTGNPFLPGSPKTPVGQPLPHTNTDPIANPEYVHKLVGPTDREDFGDLVVNLLGAQRYFVQQKVYIGNDVVFFQPKRYLLYRFLKNCVSGSVLLYADHQSQTIREFKPCCLSPLTRQKS